MADTYGKPKRRRELLDITVQRVDAVGTPATGRRFALAKTEDERVADAVTAAADEFIKREEFIAALEQALTEALRPLQKQLSALDKSVADIRRSARVAKELPMPKMNEAEGAFMDRCLADPLVNREYPDARQRVAVC